MSPARKVAARTPPARAPKRRLFQRVNLTTSLVLVFPLLLAYQVAIVFAPSARNGADLLTGRILPLLGNSAFNYLVFNLALTLLFVVLLIALRKRQEFDTRRFIPVLLESGIYALLVGPIIAFTMSHLGINPKLVIAAVTQAATTAATSAAPAAPAHGYVEPDKMAPLAQIALSIGAGVHEELVFRLAMIPLLGWLFEKLVGLRHALSLALAFLISSLLFSAAHHVIGGEPWALIPFVYRFFCGLIFATLFQFRGLAVAVYTHALYDIYVIVVHG